MKISINASRAINEKAGVGRVADKLIKNLLKIDKENQYLLSFNFFRNRDEKTAAAMAFKQKNSQIKITNWPGRLQEQWFGLNIPKNIASDVYLAPTFLDVQIGLNIPQVVIIHDMTNFIYPEHAGENMSRRYQEITKRACREAAKIIAVSEATKKDLVKILNINTNKITVVYPGNTSFSAGGKLPLNLKPKTYISEGNSAPSGHLLFVGTIEPRKNLKELLMAYNLLPIVIREKYPLVIVGGKGWNMAKDLEDVKDIEGVKWLGYVSDADLGELYRNAKIFAYPSLYEGFGIPVIEAQQFGVPVVTSNISSLPEACGDGGILIDPKNPKAIARAIEKLLTDEKLYQKISQKALINTQKFSWEKAAEQTLAVLESISRCRPRLDRFP